MAEENKEEAFWGIIIHGGAWAIPDDLVQEHLNGINKALENSFKLLENGENALEVVQTAVTILENEPCFDAGKGSFLNSIGQVELDAIIATIETNKIAPKIGSVAALQRIKNPIQVARSVLNQNSTILYVGEGAQLFAINNGFELCQVEELLVGRELERFNELKSQLNFQSKDAFAPPIVPPRGTVGAVAIDKNGTIAVAVSTGGTPKKPPGRVGDSPLWGAGAYIKKFKKTELKNGIVIGSAATGYGEDLIKNLITRSVCDHFQYNQQQGIQIATENAIKELEETVQGLGGVIAIGSNGFGLSFNTPRMAFGICTNQTKPIIGIEKTDLQNFLINSKTTF
eukprot:TRINITY_DN2788_c3_g1_i1.p1 TRINITY_DN2788_c3_g1~~TRINITY_DN2788_c3_g1_i1.p1  ORF type:complete len:341 (-),score=209.04 TRINITY_DN2788_c3_g1_i1:20-1042(-)